MTILEKVGFIIVTSSVGFLPTLYFLGLKFLPNIFTRNGFPYNWEGSTPHTLWFLLILSINILTYIIMLLFVGHWKYKWFGR